LQLGVAVGRVGFFKVKPVTAYPDQETKTGLNAANGLEDEAANQM
jgi:hypothetical protein